jgi:hypothetical protein
VSKITKANRFQIGSKVLTYIVDNKYTKESFAKKLGWTQDELENVLYGYIDLEEEYQAKINYVLNMIGMNIDELSNYCDKYYSKKIEEEEQRLIDKAMEKEVLSINVLMYENYLDEVLDKCSIECENAYERENYRKVLAMGYELGKKDTLVNIKDKELNKDTRNTLLKVISYLCENVYHELPLTTLEKLVFFTEVAYFQTFNEYLFNTNFVNIDGHPKMIGLYEYLSDLDANGFISIIKKSYTTVVRCNFPSVRMTYSKELESLQDVVDKFKGMNTTEIATFNECDKVLKDVLNGAIIPDIAFRDYWICLFV